MAITKAAYTPTDGIKNASSFPSPATRLQLQTLLDQIRDDVNVIVDQLESNTDGSSGADNIGATVIPSFGVANTVQGQLEAVAALGSGAIPAVDSITESQMVAAMKKQVGGVAPYEAKTTADAAIPKSIVDAAGDILIGSANDTPSRLAIGLAFQQLRVNSGATAPEWFTSANMFEVIETKTLGADTAQVDFTSIPTTYKKLQLYITSRPSATTNRDMHIRFNDDSGATNYVTINTLNNNTTIAVVTGSADSKIVLPNGLAHSGLFSNFAIINISQDVPSDRKLLLWQHFAYPGGAPYKYDGGGIANVTSAITKISLIPSADSFKAGSVISLMGVK